MADNSLINIHFSHYFKIPPAIIEEYGAFNISLINDVPLFIDPFLLFNSKDPIYIELHGGMIRYLRFLRGKSVLDEVNEGLLRAWYTFREVKQTWFGFSESDNKGSGLGMGFARALNRNLHSIFSNFGNEQVTQGSHLEKLCLIREGVGRDNISDFTTNLIKEFLLVYTQTFALKYLHPEQRRRINVEKVRFNYETENWERDTYELPYYDGDYILLTPKNILTRDQIWINKTDLIRDFDRIAVSVSDCEIRAQVNNYLLKLLPKKPTTKDKSRAVSATLLEFPELIEYYIRYKEENGDRAEAISEEKVLETEQIFVKNARELAVLLFEDTDFYGVTGDTFKEAHARAKYLKDFIEFKGGYRLFYLNDIPIKRERDLQLLFRLTWIGTPSDVSREVDDGRGPADFKISRGAFDKTIIEFKLASNSHLKKNLQNQAAIYQKASDADKSIKVILFYSRSERKRVIKILRELELENHPDIILIDARNDNKPSASQASSVEIQN